VARWYRATQHPFPGPRHLIFFESKATDTDHVFNPQINPVLQLRLWQEKSVSFPYFEALLLPWEGYLFPRPPTTAKTAFCGHAPAPTPPQGRLGHARPGAGAGHVNHELNGLCRGVRPRPWPAGFSLQGILPISYSSLAEL